MKNTVKYKDIKKVNSCYSAIAEFYKNGKKISEQKVVLNETEMAFIKIDQIISTKFSGDEKNKLIDLIYDFGTENYCVGKDDEYSKNFDN